MLVWYIGECTVIIININNGINEPTCGWLFGGYIKMRESLFLAKFFYSNNILNHIDTSVILRRMKVFV